MAYLWDIGLVIVAFLFVFAGMRKGAVRSILELVGVVAAFFVAGLAASALAPYLYDSFVRQAVVNSVNQTLSGMAEGDVSAVVAGLPPMVSHVLQSYGVTVQGLEEAITGSMGQAGEAVAAVIEPVVTDCIRAVVVLLFFALLMVLVRIAIRLVDSVFHLPILHTFNSLLGGVFGFVKCLAVVLLICTAIKLLIAAGGYTEGFLSEETIRSTLLLRHIYYHNPISGWLGLV